MKQKLKDQLLGLFFFVIGGLSGLFFFVIGGYLITQVFLPFLIHIL